MRLTIGCAEYVLLLAVSEERESVQMKDPLCEGIGSALNCFQRY